MVFILWMHLVFSSQTTFLSFTQQKIYKYYLDKVDISPLCVRHPKLFGQIGVLKLKYETMYFNLCANLYKKCCYAVGWIFYSILSSLTLQVTKA